MITKESMISVSLEENGTRLIKSGKYLAAELEVKNAFEFDKKTGNSLEIVKEITPMVTIEEPTFKHATRNITMSNEFLQMCLQRPIKPRKQATFKEWSVFNNWNKLSEDDKVIFQLEKYAHDLGCTLIDFEIL